MALCLLAEASLCQNYPRSQRLVLDQSAAQNLSVPGTNMINGTTEFPKSVFQSKRSTSQPDSPEFLMVIVVGFQAMNILEMHLVAWSFKWKQGSVEQDRALMTEDGMMLLTTAKGSWHPALRRICTPDLLHKNRDESLGGKDLVKTWWLRQSRSTQLILLEIPWSFSVSAASWACCHLWLFDSGTEYSCMTLLPPLNHIREASHLQSAPTHLCRNLSCEHWYSMGHMCARHAMVMCAIYV